MNRTLRAGLSVPAALFSGIGLAWLVAPAAIAPALGMSLLEGAGRSTQIGDLGSFFLTLGACIGAGIITGRVSWFYPAILLLSLATSGRVLAWAAHGAALSADAIAVEVVVVAVLALAVRSRARAA